MPANFRVVICSLEAGASVTVAVQPREISEAGYYEETITYTSNEGASASFVARVNVESAPAEEPPVEEPQAEEPQVQEPPVEEPSWRNLLQKMKIFPMSRRIPLRFLPRQRTEAESWISEPFIPVLQMRQRRSTQRLRISEPVP